MRKVVCLVFFFYLEKFVYEQFDSIKLCISKLITLRLEARFIWPWGSLFIHLFFLY